MEKLDTDIIIVGGGPSGLMLANELGRRGVSAILLDQDPSTAINPQANATQARTMEHYRRLGFAGEVRSEGLPADYPTDITYFTRYSGHELSRFQLPSSSEAAKAITQMSGSWSAAELPHRVSQMYVEQVLQRHAAKLPCIELRYGWRVTSVADHGDHVSAAAISDTGETTVRAKYLVGCDGPRSLVRQHLGIEYEGESGTIRDFMGGHMHAIYLRAPHFYDLINGDRSWMYWAFNEDRRSFMAAVDGSAEFVYHTQLKENEDAGDISEARARAMLAQSFGLDKVEFEILSRSSWTAGFTLVAERLQSGRIFIAGDAAHLFTPAGGLGYNTAIEDAVNLGWKLAADVKGWGGAELLTSYEKERRPGALRNTSYARGFADSMGLYTAPEALEDDGQAGDTARREAGDYFNRHTRKEFNIPGITFGTRFDGSPIIQSDGTLPPPDTANEYCPSACPGGRAPHLWLDEATSLYDRFGFEFTLLNLGGGDGSAIEAAAKKTGVPLSVVDLANDEARDLYEADFALIRPDQVVAWRGGGAPDDADALIDKVTGG